MSNKSGTSEQIISLPKGGGALKGIGEKFSPDLFTGTGNFSVPIALPPGRNGFHPQLSLVYSTGNSNSVFGLGWGLSVPGVSRKTSKGIPRYYDYDSTGEQADVFILSGSEDLVPLPALNPPNPSLTRYRPRTEGLFALVDHHHSQNDDYWEVRTKDGLISTYGTPGRRGDQDPAAIGKDGRRKFAWKLTDTRDPFDNHIRYAYLADSGDDGIHRWNQPLLRRIEYVEKVDDPDDFLISVTLEYEDRRDSFSDYRAGFEIRTTQRCNAISVETHFGQTRRVRAYRFKYSNDSSTECSLLTQVDVVGYDDAGQEVVGLPPLTFGYTGFEPAAAQGRDLIAILGTDLPPGNLGRPEYELADLTGDGLPDLLEMNGTVRYWRNLGGGEYDLPRTMHAAPPVALADPGVQMLDADGDGRVDLMVTAHPLAGYFRLNHNGEWDQGRSFRRYRYAPSISLEDPEVRLLDLDGDGVTDALRSNTRFECYFQSPERGWDSDRVRFVTRQRLEDFPDVNFSDPRVKLGDMSGDGLQDIVLVYDGNIEYWPNLGYGQWGKRVHMQNSPAFHDYGHALGYDPRRVLIGDVNGDGLADIVYVGSDRVTLWINGSGNGWSDPIEICGTPPVTDMDAVRLADMLGSGISGVLWSADADVSGRPRMFFLDFTGGVKPDLLQEMDNHMGATTRVEYSSSTRYYLEDRKSPRSRWRTTLPFPVQVVSRVEVIDSFSKGKLTTVYRYHHGYWDGVEREFRGFGMVEQLDTEVFERYRDAGLHGAKVFAAVEQRHFSPPTLTRTWFHQGPVQGDSDEWYEQDLSGEYWQGDPPLLGHTENVNLRLGSLPDRPSRRDALRTLRGSILRTELYALDRTAAQDRIGAEDRPYTVTEQAYDLRTTSEPGLPTDKRPRVFFPNVISQRTTQWERGEDPMTSFSFTGDYDDFGQARRQTVVAMPRRSANRLPFTAAVVGTVAVDEARMLAAHERMTFAEPDQGLHIRDRVLDSRTYELIAPPQVIEQDEQGHDISASVIEVLSAQYRAAVAVSEQFDAQQGVRLIGHLLNHYDGAAFAGRSDGGVGPYGALTRSETLVFRDEELDAAYGGRRPLYLGGDAPLPAGAPAGFANDLGYHLESAAPYVAGYYADTHRRRFDFQESDPAPAGRTAWPRRGLVTAMQDLRRNTSVILPEQFWLLPESVSDAAGMQVRAEYNYRVLQPSRLTDPNGNTTNVRYSAGGLVRKQWLVSRGGSRGGNETSPEVEFEYDLLAYERTRDDTEPQPIFAHAKQRVWHASDNRGDELIEVREYSDGFGRLLQKRAQAEDWVFGAAGDEVGLPLETGVDPSPAAGQRIADSVTVSGWQIYDNKGRVAEKYEPFFSAGWAYQPEARQGQHAELTYDPRGQVIRTLNPDGSEQRVIYGIPRDLRTPQDFAPTPWETYIYDANDLAPLTADPDGNSLASRAAVSHHFTPASVLISAQGKVIAQLARNGPAAIDCHLTRLRYDVRGNLIEIFDALGRSAFRHAYDLLNRRLRVESIDAGLRTSVLDAQGNTVEYRDSKGAAALRRYDELNRPIEVWAVDDANAPQILTQREKVVYGDKANLTDALDRNILGKPFIHYDEAGALTFDRYDFKGNLLDKSRRVIADTVIAAGWTAHWEDAAAGEAALDPPPGYQTSTDFDALNRPIRVIHPNAATLTPSYNRAGALRAVKLDAEDYVREIAYNARGQRALIVYGNDVMSRYRYDRATFRLRRLRTEHIDTTAARVDSWQGTGAPLQDYTYTYDLAGNTLSIDERVPGCGIAQAAYSGGGVNRNRLLREFKYDPLYRLVAANGRACKSSLPQRFDAPFEWSSSPCNFDPAAAPDQTEPYSESYQYDPAGNLLELSYHSGTGTRQADSTRSFGLGGQSPANWDQAPHNRLTRLEMGRDPLNAHTYVFDGNGNLRWQDTDQEHVWDHADRMIGYRRRPQGGTASIEARYLYGADGLRVKKWVGRNGAVAGESVVYIDGLFEHQIWRKNGQTGAVDHLHVIDNQNRVAIRRRGTKHPDDGGEPVQYHLGDNLGSSSVVIGGADAAASGFLNREEYFSYGESGFGSFGRKRYRYSGKECDAESGLYFFGSRCYITWLARWASCDPLGPAESPNLYSYTRANPQRYVDATGNLSREAFVEKFADVSKVSVPAKPKKGDVTDLTLLQLNKASELATTDTVSSGLNFLGVQSVGDKYLYTTGAGIVDVEHFFNTARNVYQGIAIDKNPNAKSDVLNRLNTSEHDETIGSYAADDLPSNALGALFGEHLVSLSRKGKVDVQKEAIKFLDNLHPLNTKDTNALLDDFSTPTFRRDSANEALSAEPVPIIDHIVKATGEQKSPYKPLQGKSAKDLLGQSDIELDPTLTAKTGKGPDAKERSIGLRWTGGIDPLVDPSTNQAPPSTNQTGAPVKQR
jgi:RHS repeat-associated protein